MYARMKPQNNFCTISPKLSNDL